MAIPLSRYVSITSGVGGQTAIAGREFIARVFTTNALLPPSTFVEFTTAAQVGVYFGTSSEEYARAVYYFAFVSKKFVQPQKISFARWVNVAQAAKVFGYVDTASPQVLATYTGINDGSFKLTIDGVQTAFTALDFTLQVSLAGVANVIETAVQAAGGDYAAATVTYDAVAGRFIYTHGVTGAHTISVQEGTVGTPIADKLDWIPQATFTDGVFSSNGAIWADGAAAESIDDSFNASVDQSNNFGSFVFMPSVLLSTQNLVDVATANAAQGVTFIMNQAVLPTIAETWKDAVAAIGGVGLTLGSQTSATFTGTLASGSAVVTAIASTADLEVGMPLTGTGVPAGTTIVSIDSGTQITMSANATATGAEVITYYSFLYPTQYPEMLPMAIQAATNYNASNAVQNYMFQQSTTTLTPSVTTTANADIYDGYKINYYGLTQQAGAYVSFYQRGLLSGGDTDPADFTTYANEIWLKDAMSVAIANLLLASTQVPANSQGRNMILSIMQSVIDLAIDNGTISVGKSLTALQKAFIAEFTGDEDAWHQVQNNGYWVDVVITPTTDDPPQYTANYNLVYSKDDVIRKVIGVDVLI